MESAHRSSTKGAKEEYRRGRSYRPRDADPAQRRSFKPALANRAGDEAEPMRQGLRNVGESFAPADQRWRKSAAEAEDRNMLAGMVETAPGRIIAVIRRDDAIIVRAHVGHDLRQTRIEGFKARGIAGDVATVAIFGVEIDEIDEDEAAVRRARQRLERQVDMRRIADALHLTAGAAMSKNIADLADRDDVPARLCGALENIVGRRRNREILAPRRADKIASAAADEGTRDDPADVERIAEDTRDAAEIIEPLEAEGLFMRGDLKNRIGRGVAD